MKKGKREPNMLEAIITLLLVVVSIVIGLRLSIGTQISLFLGVAVSVIAAFFFGTSWDEIQEGIVGMLGDSAIAILIIMIVGLMVGVWIIGGTLPALLYYGLKLLTPQLMLPLTFILCAITSTFTGTSLGSIATMGLALVGVGIGMGMPVHIVAGAAVSGSFWGDKMSPMSDTTNMAPAMAGTTLYDHIYAMLYSTLPPTVLCIILYSVIGWGYGNAALDTSNVAVLMETLSSNFSISLWALLPALSVLFVSFKQYPAVPALAGCSLFSIVLAIILQKQPFAEVMKVAYRGYASQTGNAVVDGILSRGGIDMMSDTIVLIIFACTMGGALQKCGVLDVLVNNLLKYVKTPRGLILSTLGYCWAILLISGNMVLGTILAGKTFQGPYKKMDIHPRVLSRAMEDTGTIGCAIVPWSIATAYVCNVLNVGIEYIPYHFLGYLVPLCSFVLAFTGFGVWSGDGTPLWKKAKTSAPAN